MTEFYERTTKEMLALTILKNHPEDIPSLLRMAELNREADNTKEASEWAKLVLKLEPENPLASQFVS